MPDGTIEDPDPPTGGQNPRRGPFPHGALGLVKCDDCTTETGDDTFHVLVNNMNVELVKNMPVRFNHAKFSGQHNILVAVNVQPR